MGALLGLVRIGEQAIAHYRPLQHLHFKECCHALIRICLAQGRPILKVWALGSNNKSPLRALTGRRQPMGAGQETQDAADGSHVVAQCPRHRGRKPVEHISGMGSSGPATRHLHGALVRDLVDRADPTLIARSHLIVHTSP